MLFQKVPHLFLGKSFRAIGTEGRVLAPLHHQNTAAAFEKPIRFAHHIVFIIQLMQEPGHDRQIKELFRQPAAAKLFEVTDMGRNILDTMKPGQGRGLGQCVLKNIESVHLPFTANQLTGRHRIMPVAAAEIHNIHPRLERHGFEEFFGIQKFPSAQSANFYFRLHHISNQWLV